MPPSTASEPLEPLPEMSSVSTEQIAAWNEELAGKTPAEITRWAVDLAEKFGGPVIVSTNFRPFEAVVLHLATQAKADIPVLWVDHGYNRPATYHHAEELRKLLRLNLKAYLPRITPAHRDAVEGSIPSPEDEEALKKFSAVMKLEPFQRGMKQLAPAVWITALRKVQNQNRAGLDVVSDGSNFGSIKVSPVFHLSDAELESYLAEHKLPNEWDYFDPAKADEKRECGLHASWGGAAVKSAS